MWKIEVHKNGTTWEYHEWHNSCKDDFIRFLPEQFNEPESNFKFFMLDDAACKTYQNLMAQMDETDPENPVAIHQVNYSESGKIKVELVSDSSLVYTLTGTECLWADMYDQDMNFTCPIQS